MSESFTVAAVQAPYVLMDQAATLDVLEQRVRDAAAMGARLIVFPEAFVPGTPIWIDSQVIWDGDAAWYDLLVRNAVVVPSEATERIGRAARDANAVLVVGVSEREQFGATIYNTLLYFGPDGTLLSKHRKLVPTGSERTVWGMGDGSMMDVIATDIGRIGGLICWENYMPLARFHMYAQGIDVWVAPTFATGDAWVATMQHIAREARVWTIGVNPCLRTDQIPAAFPNRERVWAQPENGEPEWVEPGNSVICDPSGNIVAGPLREAEGILTATVDLASVRAARRLFDPTGHYNRPDLFSLTVDTRSRPAIRIIGDQASQPAPIESPTPT